MVRSNRSWRTAYRLFANKHRDLNWHTVRSMVVKGVLKLGLTGQIEIPDGFTFEECVAAYKTLCQLDPGQGPRPLDGTLIYNSITRKWEFI